LASEHELPLNAIRAFEAAARRGSFAEAAKDLHVTHWAIGKQIRLLEDWLGVPLFERRTRGVALTDQGADLLTDVTSALSRLTSATGRLRGPDPARRVSGVVRVNVLPSIALRGCCRASRNSRNPFRTSRSKSRQPRASFATSEPLSTSAYVRASSTG